MQNFITIGDLMTLCQSIPGLARQMPILVTVFAVWEFSNEAPSVNKEKIA